MDDATLNLLRFLKERFPDDSAPLDLFIASITGEVALLQRALDSGVDPNLTLGSVLKKYDSPELRSDGIYVDLLAKQLIAAHKRGK